MGGICVQLPQDCEVTPETTSRPVTTLSPETFTTPGVCAASCHCVQTCGEGCQAERCETGCNCAAGFVREFGMCVQKPTDDCFASTTLAPKKMTTSPEVSTEKPSLYTTQEPSVYTTQEPSVYTTQEPSIYTTQEPSVYTTQEPSVYTTQEPSVYTTQEPSVYTTQEPSVYTTQEPSVYTTGSVPQQTTGAATTAETYTTLPVCAADCTCTRTCDGSLTCPSSYSPDLCAACLCAEGRRNSTYCVLQESCDCVYGGMDYNVPRPNNVWTEGSCTVCRCLNGTKDCHVSCNIDSCQEGYMLVDNDEDECCRCVPQKCEYKGKYYAYGETWLPDTCMSCTCTQDGGVVCDNMMQQCDMECDESYGTLKYTEGQCCPVCEPHPPQGSCKPTYSNTTLQLGECVSTSPIRMSTCSGRCSSTARILLEPPYLDMDCTCCKPTRVRRELAQLSCADNTVIEQPYYIIEACGCEGCEYDPFSASTYTTANNYVGK
ncbi:von Willebrand factor C and EGF domain-containing protein-like [Branchiostoma floridae]|uniref:von Willebrand factor C and EGF domain-containing protein-like n=1 Tax=Branchiostoma floridae TaxID=7739 RepID=A0A9J7LUQ0_BRAFL|nr:von Willebrand factor C and EGF domain-containing protein-like [Branchiostoma floridae]